MILFRPLLRVTTSLTLAARARTFRRFLMILILERRA